MSNIMFINIPVAMLFGSIAVSLDTVRNQKSS